MPRKIVLFIAASADGFIADSQGNIDFLNLAELPGEDYGYASFTDSVDTVILGRKTYEKVLSMGVEYPYRDKEVWVFSRSKRRPEGHIHFVQESPATFALALKQRPGKDIYCDGGAEIIAQLLSAQLIDQIILTLIPISLQAGIPLFPERKLPVNFKKVRERSYPNGVLQRVFERLEP